jgi:hypothetical protein
MTCRQEVLGAARTLAAASADGTFSPAQVVATMRALGTRYSESTIRTHITSSMCINAPDHHAVQYPDLVRIRYGRYALADEAVSTAHVDTSESAVDPAAEPLDPGESTAQQEAEHVILDQLGRHLGVALEPRRIHLTDGAWVDVDGYHADPLILVEAWAHQGRPKAAQRNKVLGDALKLHHVAADLDAPARLILCFADSAAAAPFTGASWYAGALRRLNIDIITVELPEAWTRRIREAQVRQYR